VAEATSPIAQELSSMTFLQCGSAVHFYARRSSSASSTRRGAEAPTLVFVNALGTDHRIWDEVVELLPAHLPLLRYDLRGHGLSEVGDAPYRLADLSADLFELSAQLGIARAVVCGLSLGGLVAQHFALTRPERVRALCLAGTAARIGSPELWQGRMAQVTSGGMAAIAAGVVERWFGPAFRARAPGAVRGYQTMLERMPAQGYVATMHALATADLSPSVQRIVAPTLVVAGELDVATPPDVVQGLAALIPGARFELLAGAGHLMCIDESLAFAQVLLRFLGDLEIV
jgi:3-oxoadipate enol-lactonase